MARVRQRDTKPELALRSALHGLGLRFRVCRRDLPGQPDIMLAVRDLPSKSRMAAMRRKRPRHVVAADPGD
ncbi:hypothetical protein DDV93_11940 [Cereibacter johrii]|nr:hypothetical protein DDV93_11940 [Cereibacter johrii]